MILKIKNNTYFIFQILPIPCVHVIFTLFQIWSCLCTIGKFHFYRYKHEQEKKVYTVLKIKNNAYFVFKFFRPVRPDLYPCLDPCPLDMGNKHRKEKKTYSALEIKITFTFIPSLDLNFTSSHAPILFFCSPIGIFTFVFYMGEGVYKFFF